MERRPAQVRVYQDHLLTRLSDCGGKIRGRCRLAFAGVRARDQKDLHRLAQRAEPHVRPEHAIRFPFGYALTSLDHVDLIFLTAPPPHLSQDWQVGHRLDIVRRFHRVIEIFQH